MDDEGDNDNTTHHYNVTAYGQFILTVVMTSSNVMVFDCISSCDYCVPYSGLFTWGITFADSFNLP